LVRKLEKERTENHLVLLVLHLDLGLVITELLKQFQLLALGEIMTQKQLGLFSKKLHLCDLVYFLHLVQFLEFQNSVLHLLVLVTTTLQIRQQGQVAPIHP
jgi:hypothetical protein